MDKKYPKRSMLQLQQRANSYFDFINNKAAAMFKSIFTVPRVNNISYVSIFMGVIKEKYIVVLKVDPSRPGFYINRYRTTVFAFN